MLLLSLTVTLKRSKKQLFVGSSSDFPTIDEWLDELFCHILGRKKPLKFIVNFTKLEKIEIRHSLSAHLDELQRLVHRFQLRTSIYIKPLDQESNSKSSRETSPD